MTWLGSSIRRSLRRPRRSRLRLEPPVVSDDRGVVVSATTDGVVASATMRLCQSSRGAFLVPGPWTHRDISTNGTRLHIAECGSGPLILLVHGFPEFWWSWRHQLTALAEAGYRAVACDLRGYGASDKPPRGYDVFTLAADLAGLVRALGESQGRRWSARTPGAIWRGRCRNTSSGHDQAGWWSAGAPHPLRMRQAIFGDLSGQLQREQLPGRIPASLEGRSVSSSKSDAVLVRDLMRRWSGPGFPDTETQST